MNYLLLFGLVLFSSASGALLVTILYMSRSAEYRSPQPETDSSSEKGSRR